MDFLCWGTSKLYVKNRIHSVRDILLEGRDLKFDSVLATDDGLAVGRSNMPMPSFKDSWGTLHYGL